MADQMNKEIVRGLAPLEKFGEFNQLDPILEALKRVFTSGQSPSGTQAFNPNANEAVRRRQIAEQMEQAKMNAGGGQGGAPQAGRQK